MLLICGPKQHSSLLLRFHGECQDCSGEDSAAPAEASEKRICEPCKKKLVRGLATSRKETVCRMGYALAFMPRDARAARLYLWTPNATSSAIIDPNNSCWTLAISRMNCLQR